MNKKIRILLADDHELVRAGLGMIFQSEPDLELIGAATNYDDTLSISRQQVPDVILFDCMMGDGKCIERIPGLRSACPSSKILIVTACQSPKRHLLALRNGAVGVFILNQSIEMLIKAIHKVYTGEVWIPNSLANDMLKGFSNPEPTGLVAPEKIGNSLTSRELKIARLLAQGLSVKQIAAKLFISEKTVRNQLVIIYSKLGVHNHVELVLHAEPLGLKKPDS